MEEWVYGEVFDVPDHVGGIEARDLDRSYFHNNLEGVVTEAWFHLYGCRRWVYLERDTRTDVILARIVEGSGGTENSG